MPSSSASDRYCELLALRDSAASASSSTGCEWPAFHLNAEGTHSQELKWRVDMRAVVLCVTDCLSVLHPRPLTRNPRP